MAYFAASCDTPEENKRFAESLEVDYPILSDPEKQVARAYGVVNESRELPFRWTFYIGKEGDILHIDKEVKPGTHGQQMAEMLEELEVEKKDE